jgi:hypothetical protein
MNSSLNPDDWSEDDWIQRLAALAAKNPEVEPMNAVAAVNSGLVTITEDGDTVICSDEGLMMLDGLTEIARLTEGT